MCPLETIAVLGMGSVSFVFYTSFSKRCRSDSMRIRQFLGHE